MWGEPNLSLWHHAGEPAPTDHTEWLIYPFFGAGLVTLLIGQRKAAAKTTLVLSMLSGMMNGEQFYRSDPVPAPAVYLTEQTPTAFYENLRSANAIGENWLHFSSVTTDLYDRGWSDRLGVLRHKIEEEGARYVVLDTFSPCIGLQNEEENQLAYNAIADLGKLATDYNAAVVIVQHTTKHPRFFHDITDLARGHSSIAGAVDIIGYTHNPEVDNPRADTRWIKMIGRTVLPEPFAVVYKNERYKYLRTLRTEEWLPKDKD